MMILLNLDRNIQIKRTLHFAEESWIDFEWPIQFDSQALLDTI